MTMTREEYYRNITEKHRVLPHSSSNVAGDWVNNAQLFPDEIVDAGELDGWNKRMNIPLELQ